MVKVKQVLGKNIIFLYGENTFLLEEKLQLIKEAFIKKNGELNLRVFTGKELKEFQKIKTEIETAPFLSDKKLIILKNVWTDMDAETRKKLNEYLDQIPEDITLVLSENGNPDKRTTLYKKLIKGKTEEFQVLSPLALESWISERVASHSGKIEALAIRKLIECCGNQALKLDTEIRKLCLYRDGAEIKENDIEKLVASKPESKIFDLIDAMGEKNKKKAVSELNKLFAEGKNEFYIMSMINYQIRNLALILDLQSRNAQVNPGMIARELGMHPFVAGKTLAQAENFSSEDIRKLYQSLIQLDYRLKRSDEEPKLGVTRLVLEAIQ